MTPAVLLQYLCVLCLFMAFVGGAVFVLMRRTETAHTGVISAYQSIVEKASEAHERALADHSTNAGNLLAVGSGMVRGMGEVVTTLSKSYSQDHLSAGLKLVHLLLLGAGKVTPDGGGTGTVTETTASREELLASLMDELTKPASGDVTPPTVHPTDM